MRRRPPYRFPDEQKKQLKKAVWLARATLFFMGTVVVVMYLAMGSSQAMKTAWIEDMLTLVPAAVFLISSRYWERPPNDQFPYGYLRIGTVAFVVAATALFLFGLYMFYDSVTKLLAKEHPTIGTVELWGESIWMGWIMIAALVYSFIPPVVLGQLKLPLARSMRDKTLYADALMNRDDWLTALSGIAGILGIGLGWWWADSVAAGIISIQVLIDGVKNLKDSVADLMNQRPTTVGERDRHPLPDRMRHELEKMDWVEAADVRLREEGHVVTGEAYIVPRPGTEVTEKIQEATQHLHDMDWMVYDVVIQVVPSLEDQSFSDHDTPT